MTDLSRSTLIIGKKIIALFCGLILFTSCSVLKDRPKHQLTDDEYEFKQTGKYVKVYVDVAEDTVNIIPLNNQPVNVFNGKNQFFLKRSFDVDLLTVPFKYRPVASGFPQQLNANINGNVFLGYRFDRIEIEFQKTPAGIRKVQKHRAISFGGFAGLGNTAVTPWTTNYQTMDEYEGFILIRGVALMAGINNLTVGLGVGWDYLTDRDKHIWIYQNKPWYGLTLGLNLN
jgi:hypothetical protein